MGFITDIFNRLAEKQGKTIQDDEQLQRFRDYQKKGRSYSVEDEISEALAGLTMMLSTMPVSGDSERARWLDSISDDFYQTKAVKVLTAAFTGGDCIVVPSWNGRSVQNLIIGTDDFVVLDTIGEEITSCAYLVDRAYKGTQEYQLFQSLTLEPYEANDGTTSYANRYNVFVAVDGKMIGSSLEKFPQWQGKFESDWIIPNVDRLLIGRFKSFTIDPLQLNSVKGLPICFGASDAIEEIHYLLNQMHNEFGMSEKFIMASKRLFAKRWGANGSEIVLPRGKERLFMELGEPGGDDIKEWSPSIRYQAYLDALDKQEQLVERAVGVSSGIISTPNDINYQNVDNVRKSQQKTMAFVNNARTSFEACMNDLVYSWNTLANYYQINPLGDYAVSFDWSDDYIETFSDRQNAILAGNSIGATDAVDYRMFLFDESPEVAKDKVEEIKREQNTSGGLLSLAAIE